jgi:molybdenum cofactor synthesis domain-containing protein
MPIRVGVLTVSDSGAAGEREDKSGDVLADWIREVGYELAARELVADESDLIARVLARWSDDGVADVILTTGGTGFSPRDITPEATRAVLDREAPGVAEAVRAASRDTVPRSMLSRGFAGIRGATLIVNLPGSVGGVRDGIGTLAPVIEHAVQILRNEPTDHG